MSDNERDRRAGKNQAPTGKSRPAAGNHARRSGASREKVSTHQRANAALANSSDPVATMIGKPVRFADKTASGNSVTVSGVVMEQSENGSEVGVQVDGYPGLRRLPVWRVTIVDSLGSETTEHRVVVAFTLTGGGDHAKAAAKIEARIAASILDDFGADGENVAASDHGGPTIRRDQLRVSAEPLGEFERLE